MSKDLVMLDETNDNNLPDDTVAIVLSNDCAINKNIVIIPKKDALHIAMNIILQVTWAMGLEVRLVGNAAVADRIKFVFDEYEKEAFNIFKAYAAEAMTYFMQVQGSTPEETKGKFWTNHTFEAVKGFYSKAWQIPGPMMGITFANETWYADLLENDHNGRFAAFPTLIDRFMPMIIHDLQLLYGEI